MRSNVNAAPEPAARTPLSLAAVLRLSLAAQAVGGFILAALLLPAGAPWWGWLAFVLLLPVVGTAFVLALELLIGALVDPRRPRGTLLNVLRVWLGESVVSLRAFGWRQPFAADFPEPVIVHDPARPAVLLVHGYVCNRAVWQPLLASGRLAGCNVATINLEPVFGSIDGYAAPLQAAIEALCERSGAAQVTLVCHSMGGLAARAYLRRHGAARVRQVITVATPHAGTLFGRLGHGRNARQMAQRSDFLQRLAAAETAATRRLFVCIATADDNLVVPRSSPLLPDAQHHLLAGVGHLALTEDPRAWDLIATHLAPPAHAELSAPAA